MNTTTTTRGVSEAMVKRVADALSVDGWDIGGDRADFEADIRAALEAALSAEPAAQGEDGFDARKYVRHMADVLEAGGDLFKVDADLLRLAAAINKAANTAPPAQPAERVPYCDAIGEAGEKYHAQFKHAHPLPATWRWEDLWNAMLAASPAPSPARGDGGEGCDVCGGDCAGANPPVIHCPLKDTRP